ncbi:MAG TPA: energy transducer TonB [Thermoanaerobaculia bacterium]
MKLKRIAALLPLLLPLAAPAQEAPQKPQPQPAPSLFGGVAPMAPPQKEVVDLLTARKWLAARDLAHAQLLVLAGYVDQYPGLAATALALEALADAGLGHEARALCHWNTAQSLDVKLRDADLSAFGAPGELLKSHSVKPHAPGQEPLQLPQTEKDPQKAPLKEDVQRPRLVSRPSPQYTPEAQKAKVEGTVILEAILEKDGSVSHGRILQDQPKGLGLSALEALCDWRFKPAMKNGEPVRVYYVLNVNFHVGRTP